jgi:Domain of unknown function (DUF4382)
MRQVIPLREAHWFISPSRLILPGAFLCLILVLCVSSVGCGGNFCFIGVFNPGGTIVVASNPCSINTVNGTVATHIVAATAPDGASSAADLQHILVSIRGIEALPADPPDNTSPEWQELAPTLRQNPVQADLLAPAANACQRAPISLAAVPAGNYLKVRLSLVPDPPPDGEPVPAPNRCGAVGLHCAVSSSGEVRPLAWNGALESLPIASADAIEDAFRVQPDAETTLTLSFHPYAAMVGPSGNALRVAPVFTSASAPACDSN